MLQPSFRVGLRSVSDWIAFGVRLDCVRRPIGLRSVPDQIAFAARRLGVSFLTVGGECVKTQLMRAESPIIT